jgi:hypothetical protein
LGHIVRKDGIYIDLESIKAIMEFKPPRSRKEVQSVFGKINFVRRFVRDYATIFKPINKLLKKNQVFEWFEDAHKAFLDIKLAISMAPILINLDFEKDFIIDSFASQ